MDCKVKDTESVLSIFAGHVLQPQMKPHGRVHVFNVAIG